MYNFTVEDAVKACGGSLMCGEMSQVIENISIDSRKMLGNDLFVPIIGERNDAHNYMKMALDNGAVCTLCSEPEKASADWGKAVIIVDDTVQALQQIGTYIRDRLSIPLVGITGSVGKTTTREMVACALSAGFRTFKTPANHNSQVGVPITVSEIAPTDEIGVLELGMSEPGEMTKIAGIAKVDFAIMTNIGVTHIENLGSRENILNEKLHIQDGMREGGVLLVNGDNDMLQKVVPHEGIWLQTYGLTPESDYYAKNIRYENGYPSFIMCVDDLKIPVKLQVMGEHNIYNALAALATADYFNVDLYKAAEKLSEFGGFNNRQQIFRKDGFVIIDDTYNASPDSMKAGIKVLSDIAEAKRRIAVLADMKELGEDSDKFHTEVGEFLAEYPVDILVTYGELGRLIGVGASKNDKLQVLSYGDEEKALMEAKLKELIAPGDAVLLKGSNSMKLATVAAALIDMIK